MNIRQEFIAILEKYGFAWNDKWEQAFTGIGKLAEYIRKE